MPPLGAWLWVYLGLGKVTDLPPLARREILDF
jgi:hypothetical protein